MLINFGTSWTLFLHAPCSSPTLTCLSPSTITTIASSFWHFQSVRSRDTSHFIRKLRGEEANERSSTQGGTVSSTWKQSNWNHKYSPKSSAVSLTVREHLKLKIKENPKREKLPKQMVASARERERYEQVMPVFLFIFGYFLFFII